MSWWCKAVVQRWLRSCRRLDAYLFGLGLWISICLYICIFFYVLEKLVVRIIWTSSCLEKTNSLMGNGISDIWFLLEFCFVIIVDDVWRGGKFSRSSLVYNLHDVPVPGRSSSVQWGRNLCCRRHWQALSLCETSWRWLPLPRFGRSWSACLRAM